MRVLVLGATGYVGSRLVPALLARGDEVVAASSSAPAPGRFAWGSDVTWTQCDATVPSDVATAVEGVDAVCYLVHSLDVRGFGERDRVAARTVRDGVDAAGTARLVYLSGLVPEGPREDLSAHLASRLEVEEVLLGSRASTLSLRAGVVIGAGSTSFEVVRQVADLLVVQPVPDWMRTRVQPVAVSDAVRALVEAVGDDGLGGRTGAVDVGGPDVLPYPELLASYARAARLPRVRVAVPVAPEPLVSLAAAGLVRAPFHTVTALVESLRHDMVCRPDATWQPVDGRPLLGVADAVRRALDPQGGTPEAPLPSDPTWTRDRTRWLEGLRAPATVRAGAGLARHRLRSLLGR
jgi:uncharacterized protein YbjT (DUF2867 family)